MKTLFFGAGLAAVAGLLMGAAAKPDLGWDDRPAGPQILAAWGGGRSTGPFDDGAAFSNYKGQLPDFVLGSDWKRSLDTPTLTAEPAHPATEPRLARNDDLTDLPVPQMTPVSYDALPHGAPSYPSVEGGEPGDAELLPSARATTADTPSG